MKTEITVAANNLSRLRHHTNLQVQVGIDWSASDTQAAMLLLVLLPVLVVLVLVQWAWDWPPFCDELEPLAVYLLPTVACQWPTLANSFLVGIAWQSGQGNSHFNSSDFISGTFLHNPAVSFPFKGEPSWRKSSSIVPSLLKCFTNCTISSSHHLLSTSTSSSPSSSIGT